MRQKLGVQPSETLDVRAYNNNNYYYHCILGHEEKFSHTLSSLLIKNTNDVFLCVVHYAHLARRPNEYILPAWTSASASD